MKPVWMISIRTHTKVKKIILRGKDDQTHKEFYPQVKKLAGELQAKNPTATVDMICRNRAFNLPAGTKIPKNHLWCPYCRKPRIFAMDNYLGVNRCTVCDISDNDFHVKKMNGMMRKEMEEWAMIEARRASKK